jgi:hypothetical protein
MLASTSAATAASTLKSVIVFLLNVCSSPCLILESTDASMPLEAGEVGRRKVKLWLQAGDDRRTAQSPGLGLPFR